MVSIDRGHAVAPVVAGECSGALATATSHLASVVRYAQMDLAPAESLVAKPVLGPRHRSERGSRQRWRSRVAPNRAKPQASEGRLDLRLARRTSAAMNDRVPAVVSTHETADPALEIAVVESRGDVVCSSRKQQCCRCGVAAKRRSAN